MGDGVWEEVWDEAGTCGLQTAGLLLGNWLELLSQCGVGSTSDTTAHARSTRFLLLSTAQLLPNHKCDLIIIIFLLHRSLHGCAFHTVTEKNLLNGMIYGNNHYVPLQACRHHSACSHVHNYFQF